MTRQNTVNDEFDEFEGTGWRTYITGVANLDNSDGDVCSIGIFLMSFNLTENHGVTNLFSSVLRDIFKLDDAEGVCAFHVLVLGDFLSFADSLAYSSKFIGIGSVPYARKLGVLAQLTVL